MSFQAQWRDGVVLHGVTRPSGGRPAPGTLALHGGGRSSHRGLLYLLDALAARGIASAAFDFCGHGDSTGTLENSSLQHRAEQALAVVEHVGMRRPVALIATSMGAHVACSLIEALAPPALVLFCPAAYEEAAQHAKFGTEFQRIIRSTTRYANSPAFSALGGFRGRLLVVQGTRDEVIPAAVRDQYATRARHAASVEVLVLDGAGHHLHDWLRERPGACEHVVQRVTATLADMSTGD